MTKKENPSVNKSIRMQESEWELARRLASIHKESVSAFFRNELLKQEVYAEERTRKIEETKTLISRWRIKREELYQ